MKKIDFVIIGAQKAGTTTLYDWLKSHPDIYLPDKKELNYFAKDDLYKKGESYLDTFYEKANNAKSIGMAYVNLMYFEKCAKRIYDYNKNMKIICVLRNPIDRAYSAYWYMKRNQWEKSKNFDEALQNEERIIKDNAYEDNANLTYISHGYYANQLLPYYNLFNENNIFVMLSEDLQLDRVNTIKRLLNFLQVNDSIELNLSIESNKAAIPKFPTLHKILLNQNAWYKKLWRKISSDKFRNNVTNKLVGKIISLNEIEKANEKIPQHLRDNLKNHYYNHNLKLNQLIKRNTNWQ